MRVVLIPVEIAKREGLSRIAIGIEVSKLGYTVICGQKRIINLVAELIGSCTILDKGYDERSNKRYQKWKSRDNILISLDEEGAIDIKALDIVSKRYPDEVFILYEKILFWGREQMNRFADTSEKRCKSVVTGNPRFIYRTKVKTVSDSEGLVCTNMAWGNNIAGQDYARNNYGERIGFFKELEGQDLVKIDTLCAFVSEYCRRTNRRLRIRVHGEESRILYENRFRSLIEEDLVCFDSFGSIAESIDNAGFVVHCDSTCAIDAVLRGKDAYSVCHESQVFDERLLCDLPLLASRPVESLYNKIDSEGVVDIEDLLRQYFKYNTSEKEVAKEIAREIDTTSVKAMKQRRMTERMLVLLVKIVDVFYSRRKVLNVASMKFHGWEKIAQIGAKERNDIILLRSCLVIPDGKRLYRRD